jgi:hypothetical protein
MRISSNGNITIGPATPQAPARLYVSSESNMVSSELYTAGADDSMLVANGSTVQNLIASSNTSTAISLIKLTKSRGTIDSPTTIVDGDYVGGIYGHGYDGSAIRACAGIRMVANGTINTSQIPMDLSFHAGTTTVTERMRILSDGKVGIGTSAPTELLDINTNTIRIRSARTPASATESGNAGEICWNSNYIYVCTATNTWKRAALSTW